MPTTTVEQFVRSLTDSGLLPVEEVRALQASEWAQAPRSDAQELARQLVRSRKLTKFQAMAVYQGKIKGLIFGDYLLLDKIGAGGVGQVYKAQHRRMKRVVALKLLRPNAMRNAAAIKRFEREVETAAKLDHPHIVTAHDAGEAGGIHFLVMAYIDGQDLDSYVKEHGPLPVDQAVDVILQAADGLNYAHRQGVIHRDIKPSNLLRDTHGHVTILDLGLAGFNEPEGAENRLTLPGQMMGTVNYVSPEQSSDARSADARADIYSLGCTLFYLLTGRPPYLTENSAMTLLAHCEAPIPSLRQFRADVPAELDQVFQTMLAKRPEDRYQTITELAVALDECAALATGSPPIPQPQFARAAAGRPASVTVRERDATLVDRDAYNRTMAWSIAGGSTGGGTRGGDGSGGSYLDFADSKALFVPEMPGVVEVAPSDPTLQETGTGPASDRTSPVAEAAESLVSRPSVPQDLTVDLAPAPSGSLGAVAVHTADDTTALPPGASLLPHGASPGAAVVAVPSDVPPGSAAAGMSREMLTGIVVGLIVGGIAIGAAVVGFLLSQG